MNYRECYEWGRQSLKAAGIEEADLDARLLLETICHTDRNTLLVHGDRQVSHEEESAYNDWISRSARHIPLQHITGEQEFMGLTFLVNRACAHSQTGYGNPGGRSITAADGRQQDT